MDMQTIYYPLITRGRGKYPAPTLDYILRNGEGQTESYVHLGDKEARYELTAEQFAEWQRNRKRSLDNAFAGFGGAR